MAISFAYHFPINLLQKSEILILVEICPWVLHRLCWVVYLAESFNDKVA